MEHTSSSTQRSPYLANARPGGAPPISLAFGASSSSRGSPSTPLPPALHHGGFSSFDAPVQAAAKLSSPQQQLQPSILQQQGQSVQQQQPQQQQQQQQQGQQQPSNGVGPAAWAYATAQLDSYAAAQRQRQSSGANSSNINSGSGNNNTANTAAAYYAPSPASGQASNTSSLSSPAMGVPVGASAFATTSFSQLPPGMADLTALNLHSAASSTPASAASSPGWQHRRLPSAGTGTAHHIMGGGSSRDMLDQPHPPSHNPRVAASSITGKRLNWGEMICATIYHSEHGRLVIQDLFEQMCARFPEVQEWAFGKDWEARVKNRIKSTLSIKGHLFVKVPRPSSAAGKGSWWTLSHEAEDAYREGRLGPLLKLSGTMPPQGNASTSHSRGGSVSENVTMSSTDSRYNSPGIGAGGSAGGTGSSSDAATPLRRHSGLHPLAQHVEAASASPGPTPVPTLASGEHSQQAQQAQQLAQLQAQLFRQQQAQREALPGSYDPNAPPSGSTYFPQHHFYSFDGSGGSGQSGGMLMVGHDGHTAGGVAGSGAGGVDGDQLFSSSMQSIYGTSFGNHMGAGGGMFMPSGRFAGGAGGSGNAQSIMELDKMGTSYGDAPMMPASFDSGSFGATLKAFGGGVPPWKGAGMDYRYTPGRPTDGSANGSGMGESNPSGTSASASGSVDSASGSSNSAPTGKSTLVESSSWGVGTSSWGVGSPQSIAHLGGPQSMPFPPAPGVAVGTDVPGVGGSASVASSHRPESSDGSTIGNPFDLSSSSSSSHGSSAVNGPPGPGGMYPYSLSGFGNGSNGTNPTSQVGGGGGGYNNSGQPFFQGGGGTGGPHQHHQHPHHHHGHPHGGGNNPFGVSIPGGYAMPSAVPLNSPYHPSFAQPRLNYLLNTPRTGVPPNGSLRGNGAASSGVDGHGMAAGGASLWASSSTASDLVDSDHGIGGDDSGNGSGAREGSSGSASGTVPPSPADSASAFFAFTPAAGPLDAPSSASSPRPESGTKDDGSVGLVEGGSGGGTGPTMMMMGTGMGEVGSALGPLVGKRKYSSAANRGPPQPTTTGLGDNKATATDTSSATQTTNVSSSRPGAGLHTVEEGFALPPPATQG